MNNLKMIHWISRLTYGLLVSPYSRFWLIAEVNLALNPFHSQELIKSKSYKKLKLVNIWSTKDSIKLLWVHIALTLWITAYNIDLNGGHQQLSCLITLFYLLNGDSKKNIFLQISLRVSSEKYIHYLKMENAFWWMLAQIKHQRYS
jgi:hypothetical protein